MPGPDPVAVARRYAEVFNTGDPAVIADVVDPNLVFHVNGTSYPPSTTLLQRISGFRAAFPDYQLILEEVIAQEDRVVLRYTGRGTHRGELRWGGYTFPATGKAMSYAGMMLLRLAGGRVVEEWTVADLLGGFQQLGAALTPPGFAEATTAQAV